MLFSVIIPVFNGEKYLLNSLNSVASQTYSDYEIVIVDDGSTDKTGRIADSFADARDDTKVIHHKNVGPLLARRIGLQKSSGKYAVFLDADDCMHPFELQNVAEIIARSNADIVSFGYSRCPDFSTFDSPFPLTPGFYGGTHFAEVKKHLCLGRFNEIWCKVIKISCFDLSSDYSMYSDIKYGEDLLQLLPVFDNACSLYVSDKTLYYYRANDAANTAQYRISQLSDIRRVCDRLLYYAMRWGTPFYRAACIGEVMQYIYVLRIANSSLSYRFFTEAFYSIRENMQESECIARAARCRLRFDNAFILFCIKHNFCTFSFLILKVSEFARRMKKLF